MNFKVLSVDWDFFFPDIIPYDWGHREAPIFKEFLWSLRASNRNLFTKASALDEVRPTGHDKFWERVITNPSMLAITDSHASLFLILKQLALGPYHIVNFDQHHDLGYPPGDHPLDCGNWAHLALKQRGRFLKTERYQLVYPQWRLQHKEKLPEVDSRVEVFYEIPEELPNFDLVFICRSSAWTPSWADDEWLNFILWWSNHQKVTYLTSYREEFIEKARYPNRAEAEVLRTQQWEELDQLLLKKHQTQ